MSVDVPAAVERLRRQLAPERPQRPPGLEGPSDAEEHLAAAVELGINTEHELRLVLAAFGITAGSNAESIVFYGDGEGEEET